jgi:hypothetical protein
LWLNGNSGLWRERCAPAAPSGRDVGDGRADFHHKVTKTPRNPRTFVSWCLRGERIRRTEFGSGHVADLSGAPGKRIHAGDNGPGDYENFIPGRAGSNFLIGGKQSQRDRRPRPQGRNPVRTRSLTGRRPEMETGFSPPSSPRHQEGHEVLGSESGPDTIV